MVRQRGADGHFVYYETRKRRISAEKRVEIELGSEDQEIKIPGELKVIREATDALPSIL